MQATYKNSPPFLTNVRTLNNAERLAQWERRKREQKDTKEDLNLFFLVWLGIILLAGLSTLAVFLGQSSDCIWIWGYNGIECLPKFK